MKYTILKCSHEKGDPKRRNNFVFSMVESIKVKVVALAGFKSGYSTSKTKI